VSGRPTRQTLRFDDRTDAGRQLGAALAHLRGDLVVLGVPRGGVPVAAEVADALGAPLDAVVVAKVVPPGSPDVVLGALGEHGVCILRDDVVRAAGLSDAQRTEALARAQTDLDIHLRRYRTGRPPLALSAKTAVVVDDGVATGSSARAACAVAHALGAAHVVLAVPIGDASAIAELSTAADAVVCLHPTTSFVTVDQGYRDFSPTSDASVVWLLERAREPT
jgi:putative phosphoribosyl transferase